MDAESDLAVDEVVEAMRLPHNKDLLEDIADLVLRYDGVATPEETANTLLLAFAGGVGAGVDSGTLQRNFRIALDGMTALMDRINGGR